MTRSFNKQQFKLKEHLRRLYAGIKYLRIPIDMTIDEMEKKGLVKRKSDQNDRRIVFIVFTDMAKKLFVSLAKRKDVIFKKMISKLSEKDCQNLERIIKIIIA